jgi:hypothetical protein
MPKSHLPKAIGPSEERSLLSFHPVEVARQLCLIEQDQFCRIRIREYHHRGWAVPGRSPGVHAFITRFNDVSFWVASQVLLAHLLLFCSRDHSW